MYGITAVIMTLIATLLSVDAHAKSPTKEQVHDQLCVLPGASVYHRCDCQRLKGTQPEIITLSEAAARKLRGHKECGAPMIPAGEDENAITATSDVLSCAKALRSTTALFVQSGDLSGNPEGGPSGNGGAASRVMVAVRGVAASSDGSVPFRRGEPVTVNGAIADTDDDGRVSIEIASVYKHSITRGRGLLQHQSPERIRATLVFLSMPDTVLTCQDLDSAWAKLFSERGEATEVISANAGVIVDEVKAGMSPADVEGIFGAPERKAGLGAKTIYFYPKMKVTFVSGKVTDVE